MRTIIGLHGVATNNGKRIGSARVGKDEAAKFFKNSGFYPTSFAKPIYKIANEVYGINTDNLTDFDKETRVYLPWNMTLRAILQGVGDMFRAKDPEFFLKCLMVDITNNTTSESQPVVVSDVRYSNECEFLKSYGGKILHIVREISLDSYKVVPHSSESGIASYDDDLTILNNGTLEKLEQQVLNVITAVTDKIKQ